MMRDLGHDWFIRHDGAPEPIMDSQISPQLLEEYIKNDAERTTTASPNLVLKVVYDSVELSPYYEGEASKYGPYIDEKDQIELPNP
jgi:hypothetical protein